VPIISGGGGGAALRLASLVISGINDNESSPAVPVIITAGFRQFVQTTPLVLSAGSNISDFVLDNLPSNVNLPAFTIQFAEVTVSNTAGTQALTVTAGTLAVPANTSPIYTFKTADFTASGNHGADLSMGGGANLSIVTAAGGTFLGSALITLA
jgi:hypothetical protein